MSEYRKNVLVTETIDFDRITEKFKNPEIIRLLHAAMGLVTEAGEFIDMLKKHIYYDKTLDEVNLIEELGDIMWYFEIACDVLKVEREEIEEININKLRKRYPNGFSKKDAIERNLDIEREVLERR